MIDEIRNHDAAPTEEESRWMDIEPVSTVVALMVIAGLAVAIGVSAGTVADAPQYAVKSAAAGK